MTATIWSDLNWLCGINHVENFFEQDQEGLMKKITFTSPPLTLMTLKKYFTSHEGLPQSLLLLWQLQKAPWQVNHPQTFIFSIQFMTQGLSWITKIFLNSEIWMPITRSRISNYDFWYLILFHEIASRSKITESLNGYQNNWPLCMFDQHPTTYHRAIWVTNVNI